MDLTNTIEVDSSQLNADDLVVAPRTVTITGVSKGTAEQPVNFDLAEFPEKVYRPCKSMRRVLVFAWGPDASTYVGRKMTLFNDPSIRWGGVAVGGVRISHMSHIDKALTVALTETRGKRKPFRVEPLPDEKPTNKPPAITDDAVAEFERDIAAANTTQALDEVGKELKACDLGAHRERLQAAWSERRSVINKPKTTAAEENDA